MTVCIAAVSGITKGAHIIHCADNLMSGLLGKAQTRLKIQPTACGFDILTAGDDADMNAGVDRIRHEFMGFKKEDLTVDAVTEATRRALVARKREKIEELIQGQFGITYDEFRAVGGTQFPPEVFRDAMWAVRDTKVEAEFIIAGFNWDDRPIILQTTTTGAVLRRHDFAVIGAGSYLAQSVLMHREYSNSMPLAQALYTVYEAKVYAEGETSVGMKTTMHVQAAGKSLWLSEATLKWLIEQYTQYGPKPLSDTMAAPADPFTT